MADGFCFDFGDAPLTAPTATAADSSAPAAQPLVTRTLTAAAHRELIDLWEAVDGARVWEEPVAERAVVGRVAEGTPSSSFGVVRSRAVVHDAALQGPDRCDMVPGSYLGGLTVWSCTDQLMDVVAVVATAHTPGVAALREALFGPSARVAELGCGHGLPGLAALLCGAPDVTFHDYNHGVIARCVVPNLALTFAECLPERAPTVRCASGPWSSFDPGLAYTCVLGSDVTYDDDAAHQVLTAAARLLAPGGFLVLASKRFYFGTGGGSSAVHRLVGHGGPLRTAFHVVHDTERPGEDEAVLALSRIMLSGSDGGMTKSLVILQRY